MDEAKDSMVTKSENVSRHISEKASSRFHEEEESMASEYDEEFNPAHEGLSKELDHIP